MSSVLTSCVQRDERVLIVWSYNLDNIIPTCRDFEEKLIKFVWHRRLESVSMASTTVSLSNTSSGVNLTEASKEQPAETKEEPNSAGADTVRSKAGKKSRFWGLSYWVADKVDVEKIAEGPSPRPIRLFAPVYNGFGVAMSICGCSPYFHVFATDGRYPSLHRQWCIRFTPRIST